MRFSHIAPLMLMELASPAGAQQNSPGGALPLKPGIYVRQGSDCGDPPNAAIRIYDRVGLRGAATHACRVNVVSRRGAAFEVRQSCIDTAAGRERRTIERQSIRVQDALTFTLRTAADRGTYRYCAPRMLPKSFLRYAPG